LQGTPCLLLSSFAVRTYPHRPNTTPWKGVEDFARSSNLRQPAVTARAAPRTPPRDRSVWHLFDLTLGHAKRQTLCKKVLGLTLPSTNFLLLDDTVLKLAGADSKGCTQSGAMWRGTCISLLLIVLYGPGRSGSTSEHAEEPVQNVAASSVGGRAFAAHSQPTFDPELAIDGLEENGRGWAYHGQIEKAAIIFAFDHARCGITRAVCRERTAAAVHAGTDLSRSRTASSLRFTWHRAWASRTTAS
jgi:hypothetical protein